MVECAMSSIEAHNEGIQWGTDFICSFDLMVLKVTQNGTAEPTIEKFRAEVSDYEFAALGKGVYRPEST